MSRVILGSLMALLQLSCVSPDTDPRADLEAGLKLELAGVNDRELIAGFASQALRGDVESLVKSIDPAAILQSGEPAVRRLLLEEVVPFFSDFAGMDSYTTTSRAALADGREGRMYYTYIRTSAGELKPITVAVVGALDELHVAHIAVGACVSGRHPPGDGRCP